MHHVIFRALAVGVVACGAGAQAQAAQTGVQGTVSVSPTRPGAQRAGGPGVGRLPKATVQLRDGRGQVVARAVSDEQGQFILLAPAGDYKIKAIAPTSPFPRCGQSSIRVDEGQLARLDIVCDSGMR